MSSTEQGKSGGKSGGKSARRSRKGERTRKANSQVSPTPVQLKGVEPNPPPQPEPEPARVEQPEADRPTVHALIDHLAVTPEGPSARVPLPEAAADEVPAPKAPAPETSMPEPRLAEVPPPAAPSPVEPAPVSLQIIANAYRDYTKKSLEAFGSYVEQLSGARSLDKALTLQTEFVKKAYETSVAESQRICELHSRLARQTLQPLQGAVSKAPDAGSKT